MAVRSLFSSDGSLAPTPTSGKKSGVRSLFDTYTPTTPSVQPVQNVPTVIPQQQKKNVFQEGVALISKAPIQIIKDLDLKKIGQALVGGTKSLPGMVKQAAGIVIQGLVAQKDAVDKFFSPITPKYQANVEIRKKVIETGARLREEGTVSQQKAKEEYAKKTTPSTGFQGIMESVAYNLPQVAASTGLAVGTAIVTKNPSLATAIGISTSYGLGASEVYNEARRQGQSDRQALPIAMAGGVLIGALDFVPLTRLLKKTGAVETVKKSIIRNIASEVASIGIQSGFEGITEAAQEIVGNAIARTYNEHTDLFQGVSEAGIVGAILGGGGDITTTSIIGISDKVSERKIEKTIQKALDTSPEKRTPEQKAIAQVMLSKDMTPDEAISYVVDNNLGKNVVGKQIVLASLQARKEEKNIRIVPTPDEKSMDITLIDPGTPLEITPITEEKRVSGKIGQPEPKAPTPETIKKAFLQKADRYTSAKDLAQGEYGQKSTAQIGFMPAKLISARDPIDRAAVDQYKADIEAGKDIEPIIISRENGVIETTDGSHRLVAYQELDRDAPVIFTGKEKIEGLTTFEEAYEPPAKAPDVGGKPAPVAAEEKKPTFEYQSTQMDLPKEVASSVSELANKIPDAEISVDPEDPTIGREKDPHITVAYGLDTSVTKEQLLEAIGDQQPIVVTMGKTSIFENEKYDVLKIDVTSPELAALNKKIDESLGLPGKTFSDYQPHITVAYLKKGEAQKYAGDASLEGQKITLKDLTFSDTAGKKTVIPLASKPEDGTPSPTPEKPPEVTIEPKKGKPGEELRPDQLPVGKGKVRESKAYSRIVERYGDELADQKVEHNRMNIENDVEKAMEFVRDNPDDALRVAFGLQSAPLGQTETAISITIADEALNVGNIALWNQLEASRSLRQTRRGQEIVIERGRFEDTSPHRYLREVLESKLENLGKKVKSQVIAEFQRENGRKPSNKEAAIKYIDKEADRIRKEVKRERAKIERAQAIIDMLRCT